MIKINQKVPKVVENDQKEWSVGENDRKDWSERVKSWLKLIRKSQMFVKVGQKESKAG